MEFDGTEDNKEHFEKPTVTPERLAEILHDCGVNWQALEEFDDDWDFFRDNIAAELSKTLDIREKE